MRKRRKDPLIGIWWGDGSRLVVLSHPLTENATGERLIDSNLAHIDEWPEVRKRFGCGAGEEYFSVPRGRIVYDTKKERGIIYHGPSTPPERLEEIAREFGLDDWETRLDEHYYMGEDIDWLFDEE